VEAEVLAISKVLKPSGPCNIQLRWHKGRAVCFEINLRFSGTTPARAQLGFNAVEAGVRHFILGEPAVDLPHIHRGAVLRFWNEVYISPEALEKFIRNAELPNPAAAIERIEKFGSRT
jgi:carbamoyl-phosphate synthase large subunit